MLGYHPFSGREGLRKRKKTIIRERGTERKDGRVPNAHGGELFDLGGFDLVQPPPLPFQVREFVVVVVGGSLRRVPEKIKLFLRDNCGEGDKRAEGQDSAIGGDKVEREQVPARRATKREGDDRAFDPLG